MLSLIFKFRNDLLIHDQVSFIKPFIVQNIYFVKAREFLSSMQPSIAAQSATLESDLKNEIETLRSTFAAYPEFHPHFLFDMHTIESIKNLWQRLSDHEKPIFQKPSVIPNLYNYFQIEFSKDYPEKKIQTILNKLEPLLPHKAPVGKHLLQYVYLKDEPVSLADPVFYSSVASAIRSTSQWYFNDMQLDSALSEQLPNYTALTIIENNGWYTNHRPELNETLPLSTAIFPPRTARLDTLNLPQYLDRRHGTEMLSILKASTSQDDDPSIRVTQDKFRGIIPKSPIRLVSCLRAYTENIWKQLASKRYSEENAVFAAVNNTNLGETILVEVGTSGAKYPLDIQPAIYELFHIAYRLDITVVEAAGNGMAIIDTTSISTISGDTKHEISLSDLLSPRSLRAPGDHDYTYWIAYDRIYDQIRREHELYAHEKFTPEEFVEHYFASPCQAILVGAAERPDTTGFPTNYTLTERSSRGNRVHVFAQGGNTLFATYGEPGTPNKYVVQPGYTSGAAAIIAGFVVALQSIARSLGKYIRPDQMASLLQDSPGIPVVHYSDENRIVGYIPNFKTASTKLRSLALPFLPSSSAY